MGIGVESSMSDTQRLINQQEGPRSSYTKIVRPMIAEFLATALFVFVGCCSVISGNVPAIAMGHGLTISLLILVFKDISGAHINPAVTLGLGLAGAMPIFLIPLYIVAQLTGAMVGGALFRLTTPTNVFSSVSGGVPHLGEFADSPNSSEAVLPGWGLTIEMILTMMLVLTVLITAVNPQTKTDLAPLAIGFAVIAAMMAGVQLSGACLNPARAFGPAIASTPKLTGVWTYHWVYWVGPCLGAILAVAFYRVLTYLPPSDRYTGGMDED